MITKERFNIHDNSIEEYQNSTFLSNIKTSFLNDEKPNECRRCWIEEENNVKSKRILDNDRWGELYDSNNLNNNDLLTISLGMGNICNLKCRICSSNASSKWIKEEEYHSGVKGTVHDFYKDISFIEQIKKLTNSVIHIDFPGGEPLVAGTSQQIEILDNIIESGRASHVSLHYTTNLSLYPSIDFWNRWEHFKNVDLQFSIDGIESHFEYNRHPSSWKDSYANLKRYQEVNKDNIQLSIAHTLSAFTIYYLPEFYDWCIGEGLPKPWIGRLNKPKHYQAGIFPSIHKQTIKDKLLNHGSSIVTKWADEVFTNDAEDNLEEFWEWTNKVDSYRKENFTDTFPEIAKLLSLSS
jgi:sulfatase maturation enzyme AslB (radical SAM superfamily)